MKRNLTELTNNYYDLLIIGGGIYGACLAWEATLGGLSVALVEKADFGAATSANSLKTIHGGLRYLQHADLKRMRESIHERTTLMRIAPHLVHPLPVLIPTYGHGMKGKEALSVALTLNDIISCDRNRLQDPQKHIPNGCIVSKRECQQMLPGIPNQELTGGAIFYDAQVYNSERLTLSFLHSAEQAGATVANYVEVTGFLQENNCVTGVEVKDVLAKNQFNIGAKTVVNTSGPWINRILGLLKGQQQPSIPFAKAMNLVTRRPLFEKHAVGISSHSEAQDSGGTNKGSRFFFIAPWRGKSMIGTSYAVCDENPDDFQVTEADIQGFLHEINQAYPSANLKREDIATVHSGLLPSSGIDHNTGEPTLAKHYHIHEHSKEGLQGLISVTGVKYTTARDVAEKVVDRILKLRGESRQSLSSLTPVYGGQIEAFETFLHAAINNPPEGLGKEVMRRLVYNYGSAYPEVLRYLDQHSTSSILQAEVLHAVRKEMAQKLSDVVFRRTELASAGHPGNEVLRTCAEIMSAELGWSRSKTEAELQDTNNILAYKHAFGEERNNGLKLVDVAVYSKNTEAK
ncbi:MAG: glycerol-3-phosphate dehydrogenase/oxidase [Cyanobacteria bacterium QH_1_48_107]|nr:MAG: glycerol-3-phosphate dehydrogenase/oxidase [Cyanobacteria bacterium QH_1_48_107]